MSLSPLSIHVSLNIPADLEGPKVKTYTAIWLMYWVPDVGVYSRPSVARTLMARLPRLFRTRSLSP